MRLEVTHAASGQSDLGGLSRASELALLGMASDPSLSSADLEGLQVDDAEEVAQRLSAHAGVDGRRRRIPAAEIQRTSNAGAAVLLRTPAGWLVARRGRGTLVTGAGERSVSLGARALSRLGIDEASVDAIVLEPRLALERLSQAHTGSASPWMRLRSFLSIERRDLVALVAYAVVLGGLSLAVPIAVQVLVNTIAFGSLLQPLVVLSLLLFGVLALSGLIQVFQWYAVELLQRRIFVRVTEDFSRRLLASRQEAHDTIDARELTNRVFEVATLQKTMGSLVLDGLALTLQTMVGLLLLGFYHPALLAFDVVLVLLLLIVVALGAGAVGTARRESAAKYAMAAWLETIAERPGLFKRRSAALFAARRSDVLVRNYVSMRRSHYRRVMRQLVGGVGLQLVAMVGLLGLGGWLVMLGELTLGQLVAAELVVGAVGNGVAKLGKHLEKAYDLLASLDKVGKVVDLDVEPVPRPVRDVPVGALGLRLDALACSWGHQEVFQGVSAEVQPGARLRVSAARPVAGSLLLEMLAGLREPTRGTLIVHGAHNGTARQVLRQRAMLVRPAEVIAGTVLDNLRLADPDLSESAAWDALSTVGLADTVAALPHTLEAMLYPGAGPLSREQQTLLCLARVLVARPDLVLFDRALDDLGLPTAARERLVESLVGHEAPWTAIVVSDEADVAARCSDTLNLTGAG